MLRAVRRELADLPEVVLHPLLELIHLVNQHFFELGRVNLVLGLGSGSVLLKLFQTVNGMRVRILRANQPCLRKVLARARHLHGARLRLPDVRQAPLSIVDFVNVRLRDAVQRAGPCGLLLVDSH